MTVEDGKIASFSASHAREVIDAEGCYVSAGFIDSHLHVEGLHLLPGRYFKAFLAHGTTTIVSDLHETANAGGMEGLAWYLSLAERLPLDLFVMAPSCVPSCPYEAGAGVIGVAELKRLKGMKGVIGLGEVMDVPAVIGRSKAIMKKIALFAGKPVDGHAPGLSGGDLDRYMSAGIYSDHEVTGAAEGEEKLKAGMHLFLREGSVSRDLGNLAGLIRPENLASLSLCTDDVSARDLFESGHLDRLVGLLVSLNVPIFRALRLVSASPAAYFGLVDRGRLAVGRRADLVVFDRPERMHVLATIKDGRVVYREGDDIAATGDVPADGRASSKLNLAPFPRDAFRKKAGAGKVRAIGVTEGSIITEDLVVEVPAEDGRLVCDHARDLVFAYVFDRYRAEREYGFCLVHGFGLKGGAIGTTYAHDSHNLVIVGDNADDIRKVFSLLRTSGGGMAASHKGAALVLPMPYFGIISDLDAPSLLARERALDRLARQMGIRMKNPFFQMSFLSLPVIPNLRLTTKGLFHIGTGRYVGDA